MSDEQIKAGDVFAAKDLTDSVIGSEVEWKVHGFTTRGVVKRLGRMYEDVLLYGHNERHCGHSTLCSATKVKIVTPPPNPIPEEPKGIGSIIRVVFKDDGGYDPETFYVGFTPGRWVEYGCDGVYEFTWDDMERIIKYDEAEVFEVVYEGYSAEGNV